MKAAAIALVAAAAVVAACAGEDTPAKSVAPSPPRADAFDGRRAYALVRRQVELGPRPAGSDASRRLAALLRARLPNGRYQNVPGGLRNVVGHVVGRDARRLVVVGAHYDTKDLPGVVGANDGASGTAVVAELARSVRPHTLGPTVVFILFDGEETPRGTPDSRFEQEGLRGSKVAAREFDNAEAMILLDMVGDRDLSIPREGLSDERLWNRLRAAARRVGAAAAFPAATRAGILDDHVPFLLRGIPAIDVIDFTFECWHRACDDLDAVSPRSLDIVGETVLELLRTL